MKRAALIGAAVALLVGSVAVLLPRSRSELPQRPAGEPVAKLPEFEPIHVSAGAETGLTLKGRVLDPLGRPVAGADVSLASSAQPTLATVRCAECGELLLSCPARETAFDVRDLLHARRGFLHPAMSARSDDDGRFRFDRLSGVSFTVWASAPAFGTGVQERAAPGDPVELFLPPLRSISGTVHDDRGQPIANARVHAISRRVPLGAEAATNARGAFELRGLGEGPFYLLAEADGFLPAVAAQAEAGPEPIHLQLAAPRALEVVVRKDGAPADARVRLAADHLSRELDARGGFARFDLLYPDTITAIATAGALSSAPHTIALDQPVTRIVLDLENGGALLATVVDEAGLPVPDPTVTLTTRRGEAIDRRVAKTGEVLVLGPLAAGDYALVGTARGFKQGSLPATVTTGETAVELTLVRGTFISGRVLDEYGRAAPGISVLVSPTGINVFADANGQFEAEVPTPGLYSLHAHHSDWGGGQAKVSAPASGVVLNLEPRAGVKVTVQIEGRRVEGADVVMWVDREGSFRSDRPSGADGVVLMRGLPAGSYTLVAAHPEYLPSERQKLSLKDSELPHFTAELRKGASITGEVRDQTGAPIEGATVLVAPRGSEPTQTDGRGQFELRALRPNHSYRLEVRHLHYEQQEKVIAQAGGPRVQITLHRREVFRGRVLGADGRALKQFRVDEHEVSTADGRFELPLSSHGDRVIFAVEAPGHEPSMVDRPAAPDLGDIVLTRAPQFSGTVRDEGGAPVVDAVVTCDVCDQSVLSGADGRFSLSKPPYAASYVVMARKGSLSGTQRVSGMPGVVDVVMRPGTRVFGVVHHADGRAAAGVEIDVLNVDRSEPFSFVTAQDGSYSLDVPAGNYRIHLGGAREFSGEPALIANVSGREMRIDLGPAPGMHSVTFRVRPEPGFTLWLVRGDVSSVGNPPLELVKAAFGQMVYMPRSERVVLHGLPPGRYSAVWAHFHIETPGGPLVRVVDVPASGEIELRR